MKKQFFLLLAVLMGFAASAQSSMKIGYADVDYIFSKLPEAKQIESQLQNHQVQLQNQLKAKYEEYQQKMEIFNNMPADTDQAIQRAKMNELARLEQDIQEFQQSAQESMDNKRRSLLDPVYTKVGNGIKAVAEQEGYDYVLTAGIAGTDIVLFANEKYDISDLVLKNLGINTGSN